MANTSEVSLNPTNDRRSLKDTPLKARMKTYTDRMNWLLPIVLGAGIASGVDRYQENKYSGELLKEARHYEECRDVLTSYKLVGKIALITNLPGEVQETCGIPSYLDFTEFLGPPASLHKIQIRLPTDVEIHSLILNKRDQAEDIGNMDLGAPLAGSVVGAMMLVWRATHQHFKDQPL